MFNPFSHMLAVITDEKKLKHIAVKCHCGVKTVHEIPGEVLEVNIKPVMKCSACPQLYTIDNKKLIRLNERLKPEQVVGEETHVVGDGPSPDAPDNLSKVHEALETPGNFPAPINHTVN